MCRGRLQSEQHSLKFRDVAILTKMYRFVIHPMISCIKNAPGMPGWLRHSWCIFYAGNHWTNDKPIHLSQYRHISEL